MLRVDLTITRAVTVQASLTFEVSALISSEASTSFSSEPSEWERMSGEEFKMLFDNKTHKGSDYSIFYDGYGERILRWEGADYPAYYYVRDDEYVYTSRGTHKTAEIWRDPSKDNRYRICQKGVCWEMKIFEGNPDNLK